MLEEAYCSDLRILDIKIVSYESFPDLIYDYLENCLESDMVFEIVPYTHGKTPAASRTDE